MSDSFLTLGSVNVLTTQDHGLPLEYWAQRAAEKIISVGDETPMPLREQAHAFKDRIEAVVLHYMQQAIRSHTEIK